jgi:polyhydroxyalkanoate synthesis regulator phasin
MLDIIRKAALAGIGAITLTEERARKLVDELVEQGRVSREEGEAMVKDMATKTESAREEWEGRIRDMVQEGFRKMELVPRHDLELLEQHLRKLEARVAVLERQEQAREEEVPVGE